MKKMFYRAPKRTFILNNIEIKKMKAFVFALVLGFLLFITPVFALNISVSADRTKVFYGENFTVSGKITFDNGTAGVFQIRTAVVAPRRVIICDFNKTTDSDGSFSIVCKAPTGNEAISLGIPAASERFVIPLRPGVSVLDPEKNITMKKHGREVLAINPDKKKQRLDEIMKEIDNFVNKANEIISECDKLQEKALKFNVTSVSVKCEVLKEQTNIVVANAQNISAKAKQLEDDINSTDLEDFKNGLSIVRDDLKDVKEGVKEARDLVRPIKWETLREIRNETMKEIKEIKNETKNEIKEIRNETQEHIKEIIKDARNQTKEKHKEFNQRIKELRNKSQGEDSD